MSPHDDGAAIYKLRETPRWKCGEIYTWNNAELYAVECLLCDDKNLCTMTAFATHMKVCHRSWECCSEDSVDGKINNTSAQEHPTATAKLEESTCTLMTQEDGKVAQWFDAKEQEASSEKKAVVVNGLVQQSMVLDVIVDEEKQVLGEECEVAQEKVVGEAVQTNEQAINSDELFSMLVSEATADETKDSPCAPLSTNILKKMLTEIAAGQEPQEPHHFEEVLIQHVVPVAEKEAADNKVEQKIATDTVSSIGADIEVNDEATAMKSKEISSTLANNECDKQMEETMEQPAEVLLSKKLHEAALNAEYQQSLLQLNFNKILYLIELYEAHPRLWTPTHQEFSETDLCRDSWQEITQKFNAGCKHSYKTNELKIGISILCQRYRAEKQRLADEQTTNTYNATNKNAKFAHFTALQFLDDQPDAMQSRRSILQQQNFKIIEIYKRFPILWHSANKLKHSADERAKALEDISDALKLDQIHLSSRSVQRRLHALHKCYRKEKINYLLCLKENRKFRTNFKHYNQMQFLQQHIPPYVCSVCERIFEKLHEHLEHMRTTHDDVPLYELEESEEVPHPEAMDQDMDLTEEVTQMLDTNDNFVSKEQQLENQNMHQTLDVECNQTNNTADLHDSNNSFKEQQDKVLLDGTDVDKFLANLLEKEPFMEIAAEIFNEANAKHEVGSLMHKIQHNECLDTDAANLKEDTLNMPKMSFDFSADFKYAIDEIMQQSPHVNTEPKIAEQTNNGATKDVASAYDVAYAMITPNYTPTSLDSATNSISSPQHYLSSPRNFLNSPQENVSNSPQQVFDGSPSHLMLSPQPSLSNGSTHYFSSTPQHIIISPQHIVNSAQQLLDPINNTLMNVINAPMNTFETAHYTSSTTKNTINIMPDTFNMSDIYFNIQQTDMTNSHDINIPEQTINAPQYAIITSQEAMALINSEINTLNFLKTQENTAYEMTTLNSATNISDFMPAKSVNLAQNLTITQNALNVAQNNSLNSHNVMNIPQNALNNVMNITPHVVNIPQETINYSQQNIINVPQFKTNTQPKTYYVTQKIVNIPHNSLNSSNAALNNDNAPTFLKQNNAQTEQTNIDQQNLALDDVSTVNSRDSYTTHTQADSSLMALNDYSSISSESCTQQMQQNTASMEPTSSEAAITTTKNKQIKTDFKNLKLRLKKTFTNQTDEESSFDCTSQDSHIQCEIYIDNDNNSSQDYIPLLSMPPTSRLTEKQTHKLISIYRQHPSLWNPTNAEFNSKNIRHIAWKTITIAFNKFYKLRLQWQTIYKKLTDLVKYYRKEKERITKRDITSKWFYYNDFVFLDEYLDVTSDIHKTLQEKELNIKIIELYKTFPQLWNTHLQEYKKRSQRNRHITAMHSCLQRETNIQITLERFKRKLLDFRCSFRQEKEKRIECAKNNEAFESFYEYYQMLEFLEPHVAPFICKVCGVTFTKLTEILRHYRATKHQKISKKRTHLSDALQENDCKHICHICGAKFTMRNNLVYHLNRHIGKRTHLCQICPKSFYNSTSLRVHERSHTKECPCVCTQCGQSFVNNSKLNQHIKRHNSEKDFKCNECGKGFYSAIERDKHVKRHLKIRDQVCPICGKAFIVGSSIYTHMELHTGVKKYVCKVCDKRFAQNSGLYRHMKKHNTANESNTSS